MQTHQHKQNTIFPGQEWETRSPESQGIDSAGLARALAALAEGCGADGVTQTVLIRNGYLVHQGARSRESHSIWSCSKSFGSTALGLLISDGLCSLDSLASAYEPLLCEKYSSVTLRHFVTMTSGYHAVGFDRWGNDSRDWSSQPFLPDDPLFAPGTAFAYWDNAMNMFSRVLVQIARRDIKDLLEERVTRPIGMGEWDWWAEFDLDGIPIRYTSSSVALNAHQLARFGWLFLNGGSWDGKQLIDPQWAAQATRPQVPADLPLSPTDRANIDGRGVYGFNWWTNGIKANGQREFPQAPAGLFYAAGHNNNHCFVVPEWNLVFVRMGVDGRQQHGAYDRFFSLLGDCLG